MKGVYHIVEHADGWAYKFEGTFSETFPTSSAARLAPRQPGRRASGGVMGFKSLDFD